MMKKYLCFAFLLSLSIAINAQNLSDQLPKNAKLISQSCTHHDLFISLIDLDNNELVLVRYGYKAQMFMDSKYKLYQVFRTGIKIDPKLQGYIQGTDSPTMKEFSQNQNNNTSE
jgi:hypothetical protein